MYNIPNRSFSSLNSSLFAGGGIVVVWLFVVGIIGIDLVDVIGL
jgi:hypothetical protein